jgi:hypothetical protein
VIHAATELGTTKIEIVCELAWRGQEDEGGNKKRGGEKM